MGEVRPPWPQGEVDGQCAQTYGQNDPTNELHVVFFLCNGEGEADGGIDGGEEEREVGPGVVTFCYVRVGLGRGGAWSGGVGRCVEGGVEGGRPCPVMC